MQKSSKIWIWLFSLTLIALCVGGLSRFFHLSSLDILYPVENGYTWLKRGISRRTAPFFKAQAIIGKVQQLEDEVARLRLDAELMEEIALENKELRRKLQLPPTTLRTYETCQIIAYGDSLGWWSSVKINKGSSHGIAVGDAVLAAEGLVGRIRRCSETTSEVELITDPNSRITCKLHMPENYPTIRGVLQGMGWSSRGEEIPSFLYNVEPLKLDYIKRDFAASQVLPTRIPVVTSGLSDSIPGGIFVGWLIDSPDEFDGLYKTGKVYPAVDFSNLRTLFVLVKPGRVK